MIAGSDLGLADTTFEHPQVHVAPVANASKSNVGALHKAFVLFD